MITGKNRVALGVLILIVCAIGTTLLFLSKPRRGGGTRAPSASQLDTIIITASLEEEGEIFEVDSKSPMISSSPLPVNGFLDETNTANQTLNFMQAGIGSSSTSNTTQQIMPGFNVATCFPRDGVEFAAAMMNETCPLVMLTNYTDPYLVEEEVGSLKISRCIQ
jgi:hypothetical protein